MSRSKWPQKPLCLMLTLVIFFVGCGGKAARPFSLTSLNPRAYERRSCRALQHIMPHIDEEIAKTKKAKETRDMWNSILFVGGFFSIVPWFFMDLKESHEAEIAVMQAQKRIIQNVYNKKNCSETESQSTN